jgi:hypothetical protein
MSFAIWVLDVTLSKDKMPLRRSGRVQDVVDDAISKNIFMQEPEVGDLFVKYFPSLHRYAHTGFVSDVSVGSAFHTIEGNGNETGGREGYGVVSRLRGGKDDGAKYSFLRWSRLV